MNFRNNVSMWTIIFWTIHKPLPRNSLNWKPKWIISREAIFCVVYLKKWEKLCSGIKKLLFSSVCGCPKNVLFAFEWFRPSFLQKANLIAATNRDSHVNIIKMDEKRRKSPARINAELHTYENSRILKF